MAAHGELNYTISTESATLSDIKDKAGKRIQHIFGLEARDSQNAADLPVDRARQLSGLPLIKATTGKDEKIRDLIAYALVQHCLPKPEGEGDLLCDELISLDTYRHWFRLSHRFHQTFIPERHYLSALLTFAAEDGTGGDLDISEKTDIPTGKSSGKVPATIQYARGMGLISVSGKGKDRRLAPTLLGKAVLDGDPNLGKPLTQWLIHLNLCRRMGGAENWHLCFGPGADLLGNRFSRNELEDFLAGRLGRAKRSLIGPMVRGYEDPISLKTAGVLRQEEGTIVRKPAPLSPEYGCGYGAFLLSLWDAHFPDDRQVTLTDLEKETFWGRVHGWNEAGREAALNAVRASGAVIIDKQMRPWVLTRSARADDLWPRIYK